MPLPLDTHRNATLMAPAKKMSDTLTEISHPAPRATIDPSVLKKTILGGAIWTGAIRALGAVASYALQIGFARWAGKLQYGIYSYAWGWAQLLGILCLFGIPTILLKFVPRYSAAQQWSRLAGLLRFSRWATVLLSSLTGTVFVIGAMLWASSPMKWALIVAGGLIPLLAYIQMQQYVIRAYCRIVASTAPFTLVRPIVGGTFAFLVFWLLHNLTATEILLCSAAAFVLVGGMQGWSIGHQPEIRQHRVPPLYDERKLWFRVSWAAFLSSVFLQILGQTDLLIVGSMRGPVDAGLFNVGFRTAACISFFYMSFNNIAAPMISRLYAEGDMAGLRRLLRIYNHGVFWLALVVGVTAIAFSRQLLRLYGKDFAAARTILILLVVSQMIKATVGPVGYLLLVMGREWQAVKVYAAVLVVDLVICFALVPHYGGTGAAIASLVSSAIWNIVMLCLVYRYFRIVSLPI